MTDRSDPSSLSTTSVLPALVLVLLASSAAAQTCIPTPNATYGPRVSQTKPANAVELAPGSSVQTAVNAYPSGTVFWLRAGVYSITASIRPKTGNEFIGEYGACLDGTGWATSDNTQAAFRAHNQDIDDVTIRNLVIRNMPQKGVHAFYQYADRWTVEHVEITGTKTAVSLGGGAVVRNSLLHHNIDDPSNADPGRRGGGYAFYFADGVLFENNDVAYNGPEQKFMSTKGAVVRGNFVHHNHEGIWFDGNADFLIEQNTVEDNSGNGIFYELSQRGTIRNNILRRNGLPSPGNAGNNAIFVSTSRDGQIYGNTLEGNFRGIVYFVNCGSVGFSHYGRSDFLPADLTNNVASDNATDITKAPSGTIASLFSWTQCTSTQLAPYLSNAKQNRYERNRYSVQTGTDGWWYWVTAKSWAQWQALGHDVGGGIGGGVGPSPPSNIRLVGP